MPTPKNRKAAVPYPSADANQTGAENATESPGKAAQSGEVEVVRETDEGEVPLAVLGPGDFFGEMSIFEREVRSATVRARGEARVLTVDKRTLLRRIRKDPFLAVSILKTMSYRIRELNAQLVQARELAAGADATMNREPQIR